MTAGNTFPFECREGEDSESAGMVRTDDVLVLSHFRELEGLSQKRLKHLKCSPNFYATHLIKQS